MVVLLTSTLHKKVAKLAETLAGDEKTGANIILKASGSSVCSIFLLMQDSKARLLLIK